nr:RecName: Full=Zinc metalloproteinase atrahagin; AltName: Full=Snake venom metalloproteinase; Short=SVMP [Naja atra]
TNTPEDDRYLQDYVYI